MLFPPGFRRLTPARVRRLADQGLSRRQIADRLRVSYGRVAYCCRVHGIATIPPNRQHDWSRIVDLVRAGATYQATADQVGCCLTTVVSACRRSGVKGTYGKQCRTLDAEGAKLVRDLADQGVTRKEIAARLGIAYANLRRECRRLDIPRSVRNRVAIPATERDRVAAMVASGMVHREIATIIGTSRDNVRKYCARHDIKPSFGRGRRGRNRN